jgi:hypothetical protein
MISQERARCELISWLWFSPSVRQALSLPTLPRCLSVFPGQASRTAHTIRQRSRSPSYRRVRAALPSDWSTWTSRHFRTVEARSPTRATTSRPRPLPTSALARRLVIDTPTDGPCGRWMPLEGCLPPHRPRGRIHPADTRQLHGQTGCIFSQWKRLAVVQYATERLAERSSVVIIPKKS